MAGLSVLCVWVYTDASMLAPARRTAGGWAGARHSRLRREALNGLQADSGSNQRTTRVAGWVSYRKSRWTKKNKSKVSGEHTMGIEILMFGIAVYANVGVQACRLARPAKSCISHSQGAWGDVKMAVLGRATPAEAYPSAERPRGGGKGGR